ncbi:PREDICTED: uncharacterized protein LOC109356238 [Lupinus angustifolius]|uniref:uncharacterized protein LOC109356238 n=1 Tax=Lupinus angustifolius TaxID=3871 RepID=UPI00092ECC8B|nr:PREDICTED: uncharacterized protein LOC109356238 [Lupinus angustifolius]
MATHVHAVKYQALANRVLMDFNIITLEEKIRPSDEPNSIICLYEEEDELIGKVKEAWDNLVVREDQQRGAARVRSTPDYDSWRAARVGRVTISPPLPREEKLSSREKELEGIIETLREQVNIVDSKRQDVHIEIIRKNHEIEKLKTELKIEKETFVPATLKKAKTEASVEICKLKEQLEAQRRVMEIDSQKKVKVTNELRGFKKVVHLKDVRIVELERDLRSSQQQTVMEQDQVSHLIEQPSHLQEAQQMMDEYRNASSKAKGKTKWYKRMANELESKYNTLSLEFGWKEEDKQKELEEIKRATEELERCIEMWKHKSISLLGYWETVSYDWLQDFDSVYKESVKEGVKLPTKIKAYFNDYHNTTQGVKYWRESMGWMNPEQMDESTFMEEDLEEEELEEE